MKKALQFLTKHKDKAVRRELARAHVMIGLLSITSIVLLAIGNMGTVTFDPVLSAIAVALLVIVAVVSFSVAYTVRTARK